MEASDSSGAAETDLRGYLNILRRRWRTIALTVLVLTVLAVGLSARQAKQYEASSDLLINQSTTEGIVNSNSTAAIANLQNADRRLNNEVRALNSGVTRAAVQKAYEGPLNPDIVTARVGAATSDDVVVSAKGRNPGEVAKLVNLYVDSYITLRREQRIEELSAAGGQIQQQIDDLAARISKIRAPLTDVQNRLASDPGNKALESRAADLTSQLSSQLTPLDSQRAFYQQMLEDLRVSAGIAGTTGATVITRATPASQPVSPKPVRSGVIALVLGLMLGVGIAFLRDSLDERIRGMDDLTRAAPGVPPLAVVPLSRDGGVEFVAVRDDAMSPASEAFRGLRTSVKFAGLDQPLKVVQVTSSLQGEGKTTTVANLAEALAQGGERVAIVCCDMRRPTIQTRFGLSLAPGFTDVLLQTATLSQALRQVDQNLYLLPAGSPPPNPSELLSSDRAASIIQVLSEEFDVVVIDSTPVLPVTDALVVSRLADATLLVVDVRTTKRGVLDQTVRRLAQVSAPLTGLVLNGVSPGGSDYAYGYGYSYVYGEAPSPPTASA